MKLSSTAGVWASLRGALLIVLMASLLYFGGQPGGDARAAGTSSCPAGKRCAYIPLIMAPVPGDLVLSSIEVTQAVQDPQNSVPLVAGRNAVLRIYARTTGATTPLSNVKVSITAVSSTTMLSGSPRAMTATVPLNYDRSNLASTVNFMLPLNWAAGTVDLTVKLDPDNQVAEKDESNNTVTQRFTFHAVPPLKIMLVPIRYQNTGNGHTYPAPTRDSVSDWIMRTYPVSQIQVSWHAAYTFVGNLSTEADFRRLLNEVTSLKTTENAPVYLEYYGLIPVSDSTSTWFSSGIAGIGWVGSRTAVGLDLSGNASQIAAHEVGHNLGMPHTPCGVTGTDPNYPYPDGSIGQYGLDTQASKLYPPSTKDVMSYCSPKWISDYTYKMLFNNQSQAEMVDAQSISVVGAAQRGLLVRAHITPEGASLLPAYVLPGPVSPSQAQNLPGAAEYQVQVLGNDGALLAETPVQAFMMEMEGNEDQGGINALIPLPGQPAAKLRLLKDGSLLAEENLAPAGDALGAVTSAPAAGDLSLSWDAASQPVLVRYSPDGGQTWTTLGIDVTGGKLLVGASQEAGGTYQVIPAGTWR